MNFDEQLNRMAEGYRAQGYQVVVKPGPNDLPDFAKDFKVEILATRPDGNVLVTVRKSPTELEADQNVSGYVGITNNQPGWRYDLFVLGPDSPSMPETRNAKEPPEEEIRRFLEDAERLLKAGFTAQAVVAAWAGLEAAMRRRLQAEGSPVGRTNSTRTLLNELFSTGVFNNREFRDLEGLFQLRDVIVHGFSVPDFPASSVEFLLSMARRLLNESQPGKMTA